MSCTRICTMVSLVIAAGAGAAMRDHQEAINQAKSASYSVNVSSVKVLQVTDRRGTSGRTVNEVRFDYEFNNLKTVYIGGVGPVESKGALSYMTLENRLEFREARDRPVIVSVLLRETTAIMGGAPVELPRDSDFSENSLSGQWTHPPTFAMLTAEVLDKYFVSGKQLFQRGQTAYVIAGYRSIDVPDRQLKSQIAVMLARPNNIVDRPIEYKVHYIVRDRPRLSDDWRYGSETSALSSATAERFIADLMTELRRLGTR